MADRFWVGGTDNWDATDGLKWSATSGGAGGATRPGTSDRAIFDAASGTVTVTRSSGTVQVKGLDFTGFTGTFAGTTTTDILNSCDVILSPTMTLTFSGILNVGASIPSQTINIYCNGKSFAGRVDFALVAQPCIYNLMDDFATTGELRTVSGTFNTNNFNVTCSVWQAGGSISRTINMGSGIWNITGTGTCISATTGTNLTLNRNTSTVRLSNASASARTVSWNTLGTARFYNFEVSAGSGTLTLTNFSNNGVANNVDFTGYTGSAGGNLRVGGNLTFGAGMTYSTGTITFDSTATGKTITRNGATISGVNFTFNGVGGGWVLQDSIPAANALTLTAGTLDANNKDVTFLSVSITGSTARTLTMGSGTWTLTGVSGTLWNATTTTNLTFNPDASLIHLIGGGASDRTFVGGGLTFNDFIFGGTPTGVLVISGSNTFNDFTVDAGRKLRLTAGTTQTINGSSTLVGTLGNLITLDSSSAGTPATLSKASGTVNADYVSIKDSTASGGATWNADNSLDVSGNSGWIFTLSLSATPLIPDLTQLATAEVESTDVSAVADQAIPTLVLSQTAEAPLIRTAVVDQAIPVVFFSQTAVGEISLVETQTIPVLGQAAVGTLEVAATATQIIPAIAASQEQVVESAASASDQDIPALTQISFVFTEPGILSDQSVPELVQVAEGSIAIALAADQQVPIVGVVGGVIHESHGVANQLIPIPTQQATLVRSWQAIFPYEFGSQLLYRSSTPLEKSMADIDSTHLFGINAELIIENWDPYKVQTRNIPFLAFGMGVTLWEDEYWSEGTKRSWIAGQWKYKSLRGTIAGIRMALDASGYELKKYLNPPQGFYASSNLSSEDYNRWIRLMPELRFTYALRRGEAFVGEWYCGYGFAGDDSFVGHRDGYALRGRYAFLRTRGVEQPLHIIEYHTEEEERSGVSFERVSSPGRSSLGFFAGESAAGEDQFVGFAEIDPNIYTVRIDEAFSIQTTQLQLTTLTPTLTPVTPSFEINSDIGDGNGYFFVGDFCSDQRFVAREDGGARLLAQRMYLLDPAVAAPMTAGSSFAGVDRVGMPTYTAELMVDLHTKEELPAIFASDNFAGVDFAVAENPEHIDRALRAIADAKALRDTMLVTFAPNRLVQMGDLIDGEATVSDYVPNSL